MCQHTIHIETFVVYNILWISWYASDPQNLIHTIQIANLTGRVLITTCSFNHRYHSCKNTIDVKGTAIQSRIILYMAAPLPNPHPLLVMDDIIISESNSIKVIRFKMDSLLTWEPQIIDILGQANYKQRAGQLYHCHSFLTKQEMCTTYISWIHPTLEYGSILYLGAVNTDLCRLDNLQS